MLILYKVKQLARICLSDKFERTNLKACRKFADNIFGFVLSKCFFEELFSICNTAFCNVLLCKTYFVEFRKYFFLGLRRYASCIGNFKCKLFYFIFAQMFEYLGRFLRAESNQQDCAFLDSVESTLRLRHVTIPPKSRFIPIRRSASYAARAQPLPDSHRQISQWQLWSRTYPVNQCLQPVVCFLWLLQAYLPR